MLTQVQIREYKIAYNKLITRYNKASKYIDNSDIPIEERRKYKSEFQKILDNLNKAVEDFKKNGIEMTAQEITDGFRDNTIKP